MYNANSPRGNLLSQGNEVGQVRFAVVIRQDPVNLEYEDILKMFAGKSRLTRDPKIAKINIKSYKKNYELFGAINDRARAAAREGMKRVLMEYVLPDTPKNPEYHYDSDDVPDSIYNEAEFHKIVEENFPINYSFYSNDMDYALNVSYNDAVYKLLPHIVDFKSYHELSAGYGTFFKSGHAEREAFLQGSVMPPHKYSINGKHIGPGVAGYKVNGNERAYTGSNYKVYIYYGFDPVSERYAEMVHNRKKFLWKHHWKIKDSVYSSIRRAFAGVQKYENFKERVRSSFVLPAGSFNQPENY